MSVHMSKSTHKHVSIYSSMHMSAQMSIHMSMYMIIHTHLHRGVQKQNIRDEKGARVNIEMLEVGYV